MKQNQKQLAAYLTAGLGTGFLPSISEAAIVSINPSVFEAVDAVTSALSPVGGVNDYTELLPGNLIYLFNNEPGYASRVGFTSELGGPLSFAMLSGYSSGFVNFSSGETIGQDANWSRLVWSEGNSQASHRQTYFRYEGYSPFDQPEFGSGSYVGFRANSNSDLPHYGWLEVTWDPTTGAWDILDGAYDNTGAAIQAGATPSAIPEPGNALGTLCLLASGCLLRQRKRAA